MVFIILPGVASSETLTLSLSDAIQIALRENKIITYYCLGKDIADRRVDYEKAIYIPNLHLSGLLGKYKWDSLTLANYHKHTLDAYQISLSQKNLLGGTSSIGFSTDRNSYTFYIPRTYEKEYSSSIFFKYEQPLLKGFGPEITRLGIDKAKISRELALQKFEDMKANILFNVFRDYFSLYQAIEELRLKKEIRKNTEEIYQIVKEKVAMRRLPITDLNKMQATLYIQDKEILELEFKRLQRQNQLLLSIYNESKGDSIKEVILLTTPDSVIQHYREPPLSDTKIKAENNDIELIQYKNDLQLFEKDLKKAQNDLNPDFTISVEFGYDGYDFNRRSKSIRDIETHNYRAVFQGNLSLPIINQAAKSKWLEVKSQISQTNIQISNRKHLIENSIHDLYNDLLMVKEKSKLSERIVMISKENLENEIEKLVREKSTVLFTLDYQTHFINSELDMLTTKIDYINLLGTTYLYRREMEAFTNGAK